MKRTSIKAGVVYAVKSTCGSPTPIVFLEDGAAGLYGRGNYGRDPYRKFTEDEYTKAKRGSGFSESSLGYAAIKTGWNRNASMPDAAEQMRGIDPATELARFLADEKPSTDGLEFEIVTGLGQIDGLYDEELAAYNARMEAERAAERRKSDERSAISARVGAVVEALSAYGIRAGGAWKGAQVELPVNEAEKLLAILRDRESR